MVSMQNVETQIAVAQQSETSFQCKGWFGEGGWVVVGVHGVKTNNQEQLPRTLKEQRIPKQNNDIKTTAVKSRTLPR